VARQFNIPKFTDVDEVDADAPRVDPEDTHAEIATTL